jgi:two-component system OmpR family sensor kinase
LRVKLVASVLALVAAALVVISVVSAVALRSYLVGRIDSQLADTARRVQAGEYPVESASGLLALPSDFLIVLYTPGGRTGIQYDPRYPSGTLPPLPANWGTAVARAGDLVTLPAAEGDGRWRTLVTTLADGSVLVVAQSMSDVDHAVGRLVWVELLVGASALILLAGIGAAIVRKSLRPLEDIEHTAAAIAAGDLTRRVPDPEGMAGPPRTELGGLARALNAMLTQVEAAFTDRAASELRARRSEERMRQFVADASHELRTPLTTIRGFAELYRQGAVTDPAETARLVRRIESEAARMGLLVGDLLLLARLDRERPIEEAPVELPVIASEAVQAARAVDRTRPVELEVAPGAGPLVVRGDEARLRQVVDNLLTNALTHTPAGTPVRVRLRAEPGAAGAGTGVLEVTDEGPGLTPEQAERVFERFYRVDAARSRPAGSGPPPGVGDQECATGGTGLGLAIVAALVAAHRGTVEVDSVPGRGATFRVRLPLVAVAGGPAGTASSQGGSSIAEG